MGKTLYNGNNEQYYHGYSTEDILPKFYTTGPIEALRHAWNNARKFDSKMLIVTLEDVCLDDFKLMSISGYSPDIGTTEWYQLVGNSRENKEMKVRVYRQDELQEFMKNHAYSLWQQEYCDSELARLLKKLGN